MMINQCLKCHDANGALSTLAQVPGGSAGKPFNTTISGSTGYDGANGLTACASGTNGCVVNLDAQFNTANASFHPIKGRTNNWYAKDPARVQAPWSGATRSASADTNSWGFLITCWDCHAPNAATGVQTMSVTAHGAPQTLRQDVWVSSTINNGAVGAGNLCIVCHSIAVSGSKNHSTGSAWASGGSSSPGGYARNTCYRCHASANTKPIRPLPGQDAHGYDGFTYLMGTDQMWPPGATETFKPYAFFRSVGTSGNWASGNVWQPAQAPGYSGTPTCSGNCNRSSHGTYTPGGLY
jgi:hypothetical protein